MHPNTSDPDDSVSLSADNLVQLTATITDADGAGAITFALSVSASGVDSGLDDTATRNDVFLFLESGVIVGREGTDAADAATGDVVFTVSVNASGVVTLDQQSAVVHPNTADPDDSVSLTAANLVQLTATITDADGDTADATLDIGQNLNFLDDGPAISTTGSAPSLSVDETVLGTDATVGVTRSRRRSASMSNTT